MFRPDPIRSRESRRYGIGVESRAEFDSRQQATGDFNFHIYTIEMVRSAWRLLEQTSYPDKGWLYATLDPGG
jgi:hypothetical protein